MIRKTTFKVWHHPIAADDGAQQVGTGQSSSQRIHQSGFGATTKDPPGISLQGIILGQIVSEEILPMY
jgi:hypothetical protein